MVITQYKIEQLNTSISVKVEPRLELSNGRLVTLRCEMPLFSQEHEAYFLHDFCYQTGGT